MANNNNMRPNNAVPNNARPNAARPNAARPNTANPYQQNPYQQNPYQQNPYQQNPYQQNPYNQNPYNQNSYAANTGPAKPDYVMTRSAWGVIKVWHILLFFLVIPLIIMIIKIICVKDDKIYFYRNKVVHVSGIFSKREETTILTRMLSVSIYQSFWGRIFNYGNIYVDVVGKWDVKMEGIKNPKKAKKFLEQLAMDGMRMRPIITN